MSINNFDDDFIIFFIYKEGVKGESDIIEFKRIIENKKQVNIAEIISSIANTKSGILFIGWDEELKDFSSIDLETTEQKVVQANSLIVPLLNIEIKKISNNIGKFLVVSIPNDKAIHSVYGKYFYRSGSHKMELDLNDISNKEAEISSLPIGFNFLKEIKFKYENLYIKQNHYFKSMIYLKELIELMREQKIDLIELPNSWEIEFLPWKIILPLKSPFRIKFNQWKPQQDLEITRQTILQVNLVVNEIKSISLTNPHYNILLKLLKDESFREVDKINHRKCLTTYLNKENPWNFTDWKFLIEQKENRSLRLYYEEGTKDRTITPRQLDVEQFDEQNLPNVMQIESLISQWIKNKYVQSGEKLITEILLNSQKVLDILKAEIT